MRTIPSVLIASKLSGRSFSSLVSLKGSYFLSSFSFAAFAVSCFVYKKVLAFSSCRCAVLGGSKAEDKHLQLVHTKEHVNLVKRLSTKKKDSQRNKIASKLDSVYLNGGSSEAAYLAAGSVVEVKLDDLLSLSHWTI